MQKSILLLSQILCLLFFCSSTILKAQDFKSTVYKNSFKLEKLLKEGDYYFCFGAEELSILNLQGKTLKRITQKEGYTRMPSNIWKYKGKLYYSYHLNYYGISLDELKLAAYNSKDADKEFPAMSKRSMHLLWKAKLLDDKSAYYEYQIKLFDNGETITTKIKSDCPGPFKLFKDDAGEIWLWVPSKEGCLYRWRTDLELWEYIKVFSNKGVENISSDWATYIFHTDGQITKLGFGTGLRYMESFSLLTKYNLFVDNTTSLEKGSIIATNSKKGRLYIVNSSLFINDRLELEEQKKVIQHNMPKLMRNNNDKYISMAVEEDGHIHAIRNGAIDIFDWEKGYEKTIKIDGSSFPKGVVNDFEVSQEGDLYAVVQNNLYKREDTTFVKQESKEKSDWNEERFSNILVDEHSAIIAQIDYYDFLDLGIYDTTLLKLDKREWKTLAEGSCIQKIISNRDRKDFYAIGIKDSLDFSVEKEGQKDTSLGQFVQHWVYYWNTDGVKNAVQIPFVKHIDSEYTSFFSALAAVDLKGKLWLNHPDSGLIRIDKGSIQFFDRTQDFLYSKNGRRIRNKIYPLENESILVKNANGLAFYKDNQWEKIPLSAAQKKWFDDGRGIIIQHRSSNIYHRVNNKIYYYDGEKWNSYKLNGKVYYNSKIMWVDARGRIWLQQLGKQLECYKNGEKIFSTEFEGTIHKITEDVKGQIWIGTNKAIYKIEE